MGSFAGYANSAQAGEMNGKWIQEQLRQTGKHQADLARFLGVESYTVNRMIHRGRKITSDEADRIRAFFGAESQSWNVMRDAGKEVRPATNAPNMAEVKVWPADVPVYGNVRGRPVVGGDVALSVDTGARVKRPPTLSERTDVFAVYVDGAAMEPRYMVGDLLYLEGIRPARIGDFVVVEMKAEAGGGPYLRQLVGRPNAGTITLRQLNPPGQADFEMEKVARVLRVMSLQDLMG